MPLNAIVIYSITNGASLNLKNDRFGGLGRIRVAETDRETCAAGACDSAALHYWRHVSARRKDADGGLSHNGDGNHNSRSNNNNNDTSNARDVGSGGMFFLPPRVARVRCAHTAVALLFATTPLWTDRPYDGPIQTDETAGRRRGRCESPRRDNKLKTISLTATRCFRLILPVARVNNARRRAGAECRAAGVFRIRLSKYYHAHLVPFRLYPTDSARRKNSGVTPAWMTSQWQVRRDADKHDRE